MDNVYSFVAQKPDGGRKGRDIGAVPISPGRIYRAEGIRKRYAASKVAVVDLEDTIVVPGFDKDDNECLKLLDHVNNFLKGLRDEGALLILWTGAHLNFVNTEFIRMYPRITGMFELIIVQEDYYNPSASEISRFNLSNCFFGKTIMCKPVDVLFNKRTTILVDNYDLQHLVGQRRGFQVVHPEPAVSDPDDVPFEEILLERCRNAFIKAERGGGDGGKLDLPAKRPAEKQPGLAAKIARIAPAWGFGLVPLRNTHHADIIGLLEKVKCLAQGSEFEGSQFVLQKQWKFPFFNQVYEGEDYGFGARFENNRVILCYHPMKITPFTNTWAKAAEILIMLFLTRSIPQDFVEDDEILAPALREYMKGSGNNFDPDGFAEYLEKHPSKDRYLTEKFCCGLSAYEHYVGGLRFDLQQTYQLTKGMLLTLYRHDELKKIRPDLERLSIELRMLRKELSPLKPGQAKNRILAFFRRYYSEERAREISINFYHLWLSCSEDFIFYDEYSLIFSSYKPDTKDTAGNFLTDWNLRLLPRVQDEIFELCQDNNIKIPHKRKEILKRIFARCEEKTHEAWKEAHKAFPDRVIRHYGKLGHGREDNDGGIDNGSGDSDRELAYKAAALFGGIILPFVIFFTVQPYYLMFAVMMGDFPYMVLVLLVASIGMPREQLRKNIIASLLLAGLFEAGYIYSGVVFLPAQIAFYRVASGVILSMYSLEFLFPSLKIRICQRILRVKDPHASNLSAGKRVSLSKSIPFAIIPLVFPLLISPPIIAVTPGFVSVYGPVAILGSFMLYILPVCALMYICVELRTPFDWIGFVSREAEVKETAPLKEGKMKDVIAEIKRRYSLLPNELPVMTSDAQGDLLAFQEWKKQLDIRQDEGGAYYSFELDRQIARRERTVRESSWNVIQLLGAAKFAISEMVIKLLVLLILKGYWLDTGLAELGLMNVSLLLNGCVAYFLALVWMRLHLAFGPRLVLGGIWKGVHGEKWASLYEYMYVFFGLSLLWYQIIPTLEFLAAEIVNISEFPVFICEKLFMLAGLVQGYRNYCRQEFGSMPSFGVSIGLFFACISLGLGGDASWQACLFGAGCILFEGMLELFRRNKSVPVADKDNEEKADETVSEDSKAPPDGGKGVAIDRPKRDRFSPSLCTMLPDGGHKLNSVVSRLKERKPLRITIQNGKTVEVNDLPDISAEEILKAENILKFSKALQGVYPDMKIDMRGEESRIFEAMRKYGGLRHLLIIGPGPTIAEIGLALAYLPFLKKITVIEAWYPNISKLLKETMRLGRVLEQRGIEIEFYYMSVTELDKILKENSVDAAYASLSIGTELLSRRTFTVLDAINKALRKGGFGIAVVPCVGEKGLLGVRFMPELGDTVFSEVSAEIYKVKIPGAFIGLFQYDEAEKVGHLLVTWEKQGALSGNQFLDDILDGGFKRDRFSPSPCAIRSKRDRFSPSPCAIIICERSVPGEISFWEWVNSILLARDGLGCLFSFRAPLAVKIIPAVLLVVAATNSSFSLIELKPAVLSLEGITPLSLITILAQAKGGHFMQNLFIDNGLERTGPYKGQWFISLEVMQDMDGGRKHSTTMI